MFVYECVCVRTRVYVRMYECVCVLGGGGGENIKSV